MSNVTICYRNILENSTVTSSDENTSFPLYRTYDRDIGKLFKFNTHGPNLNLKITQGAVSYPVSRLIIPAGHTLNGQTLFLQHSTTGVWAGEQVTAVTWTQSDALVINKSFGSVTMKYWSFAITTDPAAPPEIPELYLTSDYVFERNVKLNVTEKNQRNIYREESLSGRVRLVKNGLERRARNYTVLVKNDTQKVDFEAWNSVYDGIKPYYILDHDTDLIYMEMLNNMEFEYVHRDYSIVTLELLEVL